ncbi:hypothetical protein CLV84_4328 [Neolewinella xylanilytica]|uniref:Uncharacterized protein n=1 Tax=Neolewinella xylanilytica TaxID=1514080 RepID=A0A2S6HZQ2_9BACT|nr:hypothetical protein [Neolewinella xylanilytica]PPK83808.1 hypothetical protein CLV84_4328 [Neolewinella xylanilytica]
MKNNISHQELYKRLNEVINKINIEEVTDAFLYSLSTRDLTYRPMLSSYVFAASIPTHNVKEVIYPSGNRACSFCGHCFTCDADDSDQLEIELARFGGVRIDQVYPVVYYLERFLQMPKVKPKVEDYNIFIEIIAKIQMLDALAKPRDLEKALSGTLKSNKWERQMLIDQLGVLGLLQTSIYKGYSHSYTTPNERVLPAVKSIDWRYPVCWWRGKDGIDMLVYKEYFNRFEELSK